MEEVCLILALAQNFIISLLRGSTDLYARERNTHACVIRSPSELVLVILDTYWCRLYVEKMKQKQMRKLEIVSVELICTTRTNTL